MAASSTSLCNFLVSFPLSPPRPDGRKAKGSYFSHHHNAIYLSLSCKLVCGSRNSDGYDLPLMGWKWRRPCSSLSSVLEDMDKELEVGGSGGLGKGALSVGFPSLAYSNVLWFKAGYNVQVVVGDDEPEEVLLRRFRREVLKAGVIQECKRRRFFEDKQAEKKRKSREAAKRNRKRRPWPRIPPPNQPEALKNKKEEEEEEDNWELPEGELPF